MGLGKDYEGQQCSLARALEVVGERWTMLVLRDCFFGVRRFTDLLAHLDIPRAVLADRLAGLVEQGVLERTEYRRGRHEYTLTEEGLELWPAIYALGQWGENHRSPNGRRRIFAHRECGTELTSGGLCATCRTVPPAGELEMRPGPGLTPARTDPVSLALRSPHPLLQPIP